MTVEPPAASGAVTGTAEPEPNPEAAWRPASPPRLPPAVPRRLTEPARHPALDPGHPHPRREGARRRGVRDGPARDLRVPRLPRHRAAGRRLGRPVAQEARADVQRPAPRPRARLAPPGLGARRAHLPADAGGRPGDGLLHGLLRRRLPELPARHRRARAHRRGQRQAPGRAVGRHDRRPGRRRWPDQAHRRTAHHRARRAQLRLVGVLGTPDHARRHPAPAREPTTARRGGARRALLRAQAPVAVADHGLPRRWPTCSARSPARCWCSTPCASGSTRPSSASASASAPIGGLLGALRRHAGDGLGRRGPHHPALDVHLDAGRVPDAAGRDRDRPDGRGDLLHAAEHLRRGALQRRAGQLPPAPVPASDARPDERLDPVPGLGRDADRRLPRWRHRPPVRACGRCSGSRPSARSSPRCRCCSPR